jgi:tetratricopeptide (TPR) repeat protein
MEKFDDAFAAFGRAAALRGSDAGEYWRRLGDLLTKRDEPARAEQSFERAVRANPQNLRYRLKLASCLTSQGKNDQASAILEQVKKLTGNAFP